MRRRLTSSLLAAAMAMTIAAPASAQLAGMTTLEPEVIDPGAEPRQELRYRFTEGQTATMGMDMVMDMVNTVDGAPLVDMTMGVSVEADTTVTEVYEDGSARVEQVFTRYEFEETGDQLVDAELSAVADEFEGLAMWSIVDDRGNLLDFGMDIPEALPPELMAQLQGTGLAVQPLPEEPVGVGARWVAAGSIPSQGIDLEMTVETEIVDLDAGSVLLETRLSGDADMASALFDELPPGVELTVDRVVAGGDGRVEVHLASLIPTSEAAIDVELAMSVSAEDGGEVFESSMAFGMSMEMSVAPVEPFAP